MSADNSSGHYELVREEGLLELNFLVRSIFKVRTTDELWQRMTGPGRRGERRDHVLERIFRGPYATEPTIANVVWLGARVVLDWLSEVEAVQGKATLDHRLCEMSISEPDQLEHWERPLRARPPDSQAE